MVGQETQIPKKRGPKPKGIIGLMVRVLPDFVQRLDHWISKQPDPKPTRPEAIRRLVDAVLDHH
jgi:hypothetical protein